MVTSGPSAASLAERTKELVDAAGYGADDPLVVGVQDGAAPATFLGRGRGRSGAPLGAGSVLYTASLAKQVTAVAVALLVQQGRLDLETPLARWLPELPAWAETVRLRHLLSHTGGLPEGVDFDELDATGRDRTTEAVVAALGRLDLVHAPGTEHRYSNAGYVCLALAVARAAGRPFAEVARAQVLAPLGMTASRWWSGPEPQPPGAEPLDAACPAPLSLGDGGLWSSASDLLRWNRAMQRDALGVAALVQTPGRLDNGTPLSYAWGVDVRQHAGLPVLAHGGRWAGLCAQLVRLGGGDRPGSGLVVLALDDDEERASGLAGALLDELGRRAATP